MIVTWQDVQNRYAEMDKLPNGTSPTVQAAIMTAAEASVTGRLAARFAVPLAAGNLTAIDLIVDTVYVQNMLTRQPEKTKLLKDSLDERIKALLGGTAQMVGSGGVVLATVVADTVWSSTENYPPTFGMSDDIKAEVSSERLYDEDATRGEYR